MMQLKKKWIKIKQIEKKNEGQTQKKNNLKDLYENYGGLGTNFQAKREKKRKEKENDVGDALEVWRLHRHTRTKIRLRAIKWCGRIKVLTTGISRTHNLKATKWLMCLMHASTTFCFFFFFKHNSTLQT